MVTNEIVRRWSEIYNLPVMISNDKRRVGTVVDFFYEPDTNNIRALLVMSSLQEPLMLLSAYIQSIEADAVMISKKEVLIESLPNLPQGRKLFGLTVAGESGREVGTIGEILIGTVPVVALRISSFALFDGSSSQFSRQKIFSAHNVVRYYPERVVIFDQVANKLA